MASKFLAYVNQTGSPYHSVSVAKKFLIDRGFSELVEGKVWKLERGGRYVLTRGGSDIFAFVVGKTFDAEKHGFAIVGAHTDSPCLRLRPKTNIAPVGDYVQVGVHVYGGGLWHTWLDRDLGLAGKVVYKEDGVIKETLVRIAKPILTIPNLAIHLQTADERKAFLVNPETHLQPILLTAPDAKKSEGRHPSALLEAVASRAGIPADSITDMDLCLFDAQAGCTTGVNDDFIATGRVDNLASTWACVEAIADCDPNEISDIAVSVAFDHEECGSQSQTGAESNALQVWLQKVGECFGAGGTNDFMRTIHRSFLISADGVHGLHPNYAAKHQSEHRPCLNGGIVIKTNPNQRYATTCTGASYIREIGEKCNVKIQDICVKNDSPCGSTIGPIISAKLGVRAVDLGISQLAMHSCRETCGAHDLAELYKFCLGFFKELRGIDSAARGL